MHANEYLIFFLYYLISDYHKIGFISLHLVRKIIKKNADPIQIKKSEQTFCSLKNLSTTNEKQNFIFIHNNYRL